MESLETDDAKRILESAIAADEIGDKDTLWNLLEEYQHCRRCDVEEPEVNGTKGDSICDRLAIKLDGRPMIEGIIFPKYPRNNGSLKDRRFNIIWMRLADRGYCDSIGGMEYSRVLAEWRRDGRPMTNLKKFIKSQCN